jgi:hypothetical protein
MRINQSINQTGAAPMEGITTSDNPVSQTGPMEGITIDGPARPTIEEFSEWFLSSGGLDDTRHVPIGVESEAQRL